MTHQRATDPPRLVVTVLTESEANAGSILRLIDGQQPSDTRILYCANLPAETAAALHDVAPASSFSHAEHRSLLDTATYWSALDAQLTDLDGPVLVTRAGTWLPDRCWGRFYGAVRQCARRVFPLTARGECTSVFLSPDHEPGLSAEQIDHWLNQYCEGALFDIPYPDGFTALLPGLPSQASPSDCCSDAVFIDDRHTAPRHLPDELPPAYVTAFRDRHPLTGLRHAMTELSQRRESPPAALPKCTAVTLHLSHGWGGGLWRWIEDFCAHDDQATNLILKPIGDRSAYAQTMELVDARQPQIPLLRKTFASPILSTAVGHCEYQALLAEICERYSVSAVYVSSLIGHATDALRTELPTVLVLHNFFPVCPAIIATYEGPCTSCDDARMADCFAKNPRQQFFLSENQEHWRLVREAFREVLSTGSIKCIAPSRSVVQRLGSLLDSTDALPAAVIPHGLPNADVEVLAQLRTLNYDTADRLRVVILGGQEAHKGGELATALVERLDDVADFFLLGFGEDLSELARHSHVQTLDSYGPGQLHDLLGTYQAHLGMLLSTVPETFSYTLSELQGAGIPALATNLGAFADRIEHGTTGWLTEPDADAVEDALRYLNGHREELTAAREQLLSETIRSAGEMVEDYRQHLLPIASAARGRPLVEVASAFTEEGRLLVREDTRYAEALREFFAYSRRKLIDSPRLGDRGRRVLRKLLGP